MSKIAESDKWELVSVTAFSNPYLFWFIHQEDVIKRAIYTRQLNSVAKLQSSVNEPAIGTTVIIKYGATWVRAKVDDIRQTRDEVNKNEYVCWLLDYGIYTIVTELYNFPKDFVEIPAFAKRAVLYGIVPSEQKINYDRNIIETVLTSRWEEGVRKAVNELLKEPNTKWLFMTKFNLNDAYVGNIDIITSRGSCSLRDYIIQMGFAVFKENEFKNIILGTDVTKFNVKIIESNAAALKLILSNKASINSNVDGSAGRGCRRKSAQTSNTFEAGSKSATSSSSNCFEDSPDENSTYSSFDKPVRLLSSTPKTNPSTTNLTKVEALLKEQVKLKNQKQESINDSSTSESDITENISKTQLSLKKPLCPIQSNDVNSSDDSSMQLYEGKFSKIKHLLNLQQLKKKAKDSNQKMKSSTSSEINLETNNKVLTSETNDNVTLLENIVKKSSGRGFSFTKTNDHEAMPLTVPEECFEDATEISNIEKANTESNSNNFLKDCNTNPPITTSSPRKKLLKLVPYKPSGVNMGLSTSKAVSSKKENKNSSNSNTETSSLKHIDKKHFNSETESQNSFNENENICNTIQKSETSEKYSENNDEWNEESQYQRGNTNAVRVVKYVSENNCKCATCTSWETTNDAVFEPCLKKQEVAKEIVSKPALLFKKDKDGKFDLHYKVKSQDYTNAIDKLTEPMLLVHGHFAPKPVNDVLRVPFHTNVHTALKNLKYDKAYRVQTYAWPAIMRGHHVFVVNGPETGKTMVYVPTFSSFVLRYSKKLGPKMGPICLVICPVAAVAEKVYKLFQFMLMHKKVKIDILMTSLKNNFQKRQQEGVDILISTVPVLVEALNEGIIPLKRLIHVALENAYELFNKFPKEMDTVLACLQSALCTRTYSQSIQMIVLSKMWSQPIEKLMQRLLRAPIVCIGACLEAAIYGRVNMQVQFLNSSRKPTSVVDKISKECKLYKTLIVCNKIEEMSETLKYMDVYGINYIAIHSNSTIEDITDARSRWESAICGMYFVLVCTDDLLNTSICIDDASVMVQYSLPPTWSQFTYRFSAFLENYSSPRVQEAQTKCIMHIYVDERNTEQFPKMINFLQRLNVNLNKEFMDLYSKSIRMLEDTKIANKIELCQKLKLCGTCPLIHSCEKRHYLSRELDILETVPQSGLIKVHILYMCSPSKYYAHLLEYTDASGTVHTIQNKYADLAIKMSNMAKEIKGRFILEVQTGNLYVFEETVGVFKRCRIAHISKYDSMKRPIEAGVRCIDTGIFRFVPTSALYELPKEFEDIPPLAVEIIIANVSPADRDTSYSSIATQTMRKKLNVIEYLAVGTYATARIRLTLRSTIWVTNLVIKENLRENIPLVKMVITATLLKNKLAETNVKHLEDLYKLCKDMNISLPNYELPAPKTKNIAQVKPAWAHLENLEEYNQVYFSAANNPELFYVRLCKNQKPFDALVKDMCDTIKKPHFPKSIEVLEGCCYLAKDPESVNYGRVQVLKLEQKKASCFFVDYGDYAVIPAAELKYLANEFIERLPFQAIECTLWGILPKREWTDKATDILYNYAFEPETDFLRPMYVKVMEKKEPTVTAYKKYSVILIDIFNSDTVVNDVFVDENFAIRSKNETTHVDFERLHLLKTSPKQENYDSDDLDTMTDINNSESVSSDENVDGDDEWDFEINDPGAFFSNFIKIPTKKPTTEESSSSRKVPKKHFKVLPKTGFLVPDTVWKQNDTHITLQIIVAEVKTYDINVIRNKIFSLKATCDNKIYKLDLNLFAKVSSEVEHNAYGLYILVKLNKEENGEWDRLVINSDRMRHIKYDTSQLKVENDSDEEFVLPKRRKPPVEEDENGEYIYEYGSDVDYDDSDFGFDSD